VSADNGGGRSGGRLFHENREASLRWELCDRVRGGLRWIVDERAGRRCRRRLELERWIELGVELRIKLGIELGIKLGIELGRAGRDRRSRSDVRQRAGLHQPRRRLLRQLRHGGRDGRRRDQRVRRVVHGHPALHLVHGVPRRRPVRGVRRHDGRNDVLQPSARRCRRPDSSRRRRAAQGRRWADGRRGRSQRHRRGVTRAARPIRPRHARPRAAGLRVRDQAVREVSHAKRIHLPQVCRVSTTKAHGKFRLIEMELVDGEHRRAALRLTSAASSPLTPAMPGTHTDLRSAGCAFVVSVRLAQPGRHPFG
jgi:hypothetical protein